MSPTATNSGQALQQLQGFQQNMQSPDQIVSGTEQSLGVPGAQQQVSGLRQAITNTTNLLNNVAPSVYGRTQSSLVTDAQAGKQISNESAPIQKSLADQTTKEGQSESDLQSLLGRAGTLESLKASGQTDKLAALQKIYDSLYGQEQDAAKMAEQKREFNANLAKASASGGSSGGSGSSRSSGGSASSGGGAPGLNDIIGYFKTADSQYGAYNPTGTNYHRWQAAEQTMLQYGLDPNQYKKQLAAAFGSAADKKAYGVAGYK